MSAPLVVNTRDGMCWTRRVVTSSGIALYAPEGVCSCPSFVMATLEELAEHGIVGSADALPVPAGPERQEYGPVFPWAALMDDEDFYDFRADVVAATAHRDRERALEEMEKVVSTWRLIAEAQHAHNTAPGPDALTRTFASVQALRDPEGEHYASVHHAYRTGRDLPETGGAR